MPSPDPQFDESLRSSVRSPGNLIQKSARPGGEQVRTTRKGRELHRCFRPFPVPYPVSSPSPALVTSPIADPGQVYFFPPEVREGPGKGDRPHLVLSLCSEEPEVAAFACGSTKAMDAGHGPRTSW